MAIKSHTNKHDFIKIISMMTNTELNDYIKRHGPGPKPVVMCYIVDNSIKKTLPKEKIL